MLVYSPSDWPKLRTAFAPRVPPSRQRQFCLGIFCGRLITVPFLNLVCLHMHSKFGSQPNQLGEDLLVPRLVQHSAFQIVATKTSNSLYSCLNTYLLLSLLTAIARSNPWLHCPIHPLSFFLTPPLLVPSQLIMLVSTILPIHWLSMAREVNLSFRGAGGSAGANDASLTWNSDQPYRHQG